MQSELPFELQGLSQAVNYQHWVCRAVRPYLGKRILEVGAGVGNMSRWLPREERLILSEMDGALLKILVENETELLKDSRVSTTSLDLVTGDLEPLLDENLDTIVSFNVLEHIEDDQGALGRLTEILRKSRAPGAKRLVSFLPAHSWAYGSMDRAFGHFRRYDQRRWLELCRAVAPDAQLEMRYFNLVGLLGWVFNGKLMGRDRIGQGSIAAFEKICPLIAPFDDFLHEKMGLPIGQSLLAVMTWKAS